MIENEIELIAYFKFIDPLQFSWENQSWLCQRFLTVQLEKYETQFNCKNEIPF
jgi:hypothetical protein